MTELERIALCIAIEAPRRRNKYSVSATVSWSLIEQLRAELEKRGMDWRELRDRADEIADRAICSWRPTNP